MIRIAQTRLFWIGAALAVAALLGAASPAAHATDATFERTLTVGSKLDLSVATGAGTIHIKRGSAGSIHILGRVRPGWGTSDDRAREIAAHPPIQQTGNIVRVGSEHENLRNISIDYEIEAPDNVILDAATGSGEILDDGVGQEAKLSTGSGTIHATALKGAFKVETGSGNIFADQTGSGDVKAETGSGSIELHHIQGALKAETGSGSIKVDGTPISAWKLETGSGSIEIWTGNASISLDAESGSGSVHSDREVQAQSSEDHHHLTGKIGGGGPPVRLETGSGSIRVH
jgi:hypothetical protein